MGLTYSQAKSLGLEHLWPAESKPLPESPRPPSEAIDDGMNKTEARFARGLSHMKTSRTILDWEFEPVKFRLADRTYLTPDFRIVLPSWQTIFAEIKGGFIRDDAIVKAKVVAENHPYAFFLAVYKDQRWTITRLPSRKWGSIQADIDWDI